MFVKYNYYIERRRICYKMGIRGGFQRRWNFSWIEVWLLQKLPTASYPPPSPCVRLLSQVSSVQMHYARCSVLISVTAFSFTHPPVLSALLLIFSSPRFPAVGSRAFSVFRPSTWNELLPLRWEPSLHSFKSNLKTFIFHTPKKEIPAVFSVPCCCLAPPQIC